MENKCKYLDKLQEIASIKVNKENAEELKELYSKEKEGFKSYVNNLSFALKFIDSIDEICFTFINTYNFICSNEYSIKGLEFYFDIIQMIKESNPFNQLTPSEIYNNLRKLREEQAVNIIKSAVDKNKVTEFIRAYINGNENEFKTLLSSSTNMEKIFCIYFTIKLKNQDLMYCGNDIWNKDYERMKYNITRHKNNIEAILNTINSEESKLINIFGVNDFIRRRTFIDFNLNITKNLAKIIDDMERFNIEGNLLSILQDYYELIDYYIKLYCINILPYISNEERDIVSNLIGWGFFGDLDFSIKGIIETSKIHNSYIDNEVINKLKPYLDKVIEKGYITKTESGYVLSKKFSKTLLAYLCGKIFCNDYIKIDGNNEEIWKAGKENLFFPEKDINMFFSEKNIGVIRRGKIGNKAPKRWKEIDSLFE